VNLAESAVEAAASIVAPELTLPLKILSWCKSGLGGALTWAVKNPFVVGCVVLGAATWWYHHEDVKTKAELVTQADTFKAAQAAADAKAAALAKQYQMSAQEAQNNEQSNLATANAAGAAYKHVNSVRVVYRGSSIVLPASGSTPISQGAPASAIVVSNPDFDACTADYVYALNAYKWAKSLNSAASTPEAP